MRIPGAEVGEVEGAINEWDTGNSEGYEMPVVARRGSGVQAAERGCAGEETL
jgi:hypothetical protein